MKTKYLSLILTIVALMFSTGCEQVFSPTTGWAYNTEGNGGFDVVDFIEQETGPGLVLVEGGTFAMGRVEQDVLYDWNNVPRRVTVSSFYMDETEVRNVDYREYLYWVSRVFVDFPEVYRRTLPDTLVWRSKLAWYEEHVELYLRHPAYNNYPVVGVNWLQARDYCAWRTDRVNELILIREGLLDWDPTGQIAENNFNYDAYIAGQYEGLVNPRTGGMLPDLDPNKEGRKVRIEDGIFLPRYRLPTEAEWEFAALALIGEHFEERIYQRRLYPWTGHYIRSDQEETRGIIRANIVRGRGDYMGVAHALNDKADVTGPVDNYWPNEYGLYCMAGNVNEWVMDIYRNQTLEDMDEFRPFRGNVYETYNRDEENIIVEKDSLGRIPTRKMTEDESYNRRNYNQADNINFLDGDWESNVEPSLNWNNATPEQIAAGSENMYKYGEWNLDAENLNQRMRGKGMTSMINDHARVFKGGGWQDRVYWMVPGTRRYLDENQARPDLGFRCAMHRVGSQVGGGF